jgi:hypothetical protein
MVAAYAEAGTIVFAGRTRGFKRAESIVSRFVSKWLSRRIHLIDARMEQWYPRIQHIRG